MLKKCLNLLLTVLLSVTLLPISYRVLTAEENETITQEEVVEKIEELQNEATEKVAEEIEVLQENEEIIEEAAEIVGDSVEPIVFNGLQIGEDVTVAKVFEALGVSSDITDNLASSASNSVSTTNNGKYRIDINGTSIISSTQKVNVGNGENLSYSIKQAYRNSSYDKGWNTYSSGSYSVGTRYGNLVCNDDDIKDIKINDVSVETVKGTHKVNVGDKVVISCENIDRLKYVISVSTNKAPENSDYVIESWGSTNTYKQLETTATYSIDGTYYEQIENADGVFYTPSTNGSSYKFSVRPDTQGYYVKSITVEEMVDGEPVEPANKKVETDLTYTYTGGNRGVATTKNSYDVLDLSDDDSIYVITAEIVPELVTKTQPSILKQSYSNTLKNTILSAVVDTEKSVVKETGGDINFDDLTVKYYNGKEYADLDSNYTYNGRHKFGSSDKETIRITWNSNNNKYTGISISELELNLVDQWIYDYVDIDATVDNIDKVNALGNKNSNTISYVITPDNGYYVNGVTVTADKGEEAVAITNTNYDDGKFSFDFSIEGRDADTVYTIHIDNKCEYEINDNPVLHWLSDDEVTSDNKATWEGKIVEAILSNLVRETGDSFIVKYDAGGMAIAGGGDNNITYKPGVTKPNQHAFGEKDSESISLEYKVASSDDKHTGYTIKKAIALKDTRLDKITVDVDSKLIDKVSEKSVNGDNLVTVKIYPNNGKYVDSITVNDGTEDIDLGDNNPSYSNGVATVTFTMSLDKEYTVTPDIKSEYVEDGDLIINYAYNSGMSLTDDKVLDAIINTRLSEGGEYVVKYRSYENKGFLDIHDDRYDTLDYEGKVEYDAIDVLHVNPYQTHSFGVEEDGVTLREKELINIKFTASDDKYTDFEINGKEISLVDERKDSKIYLNPSLTSALNVLFVQYADSASLKETVAKNITIFGLNEDDSLVYPPIEFTASDIIIEPEVLDAKYLQAQPVTIKFKGNDDYKGCTNDEIKLYVAHLYSDIDIDVKSKQYKEGEPAEIKIATNPEGINYISIVAGIEGDVSGLISINYDTNQTKSLISDVNLITIGDFEYTLYNVLDGALAGQEFFLNIIKRFVPTLEIDSLSNIVKEGDYYYLDYGHILKNRLPLAIKDKTGLALTTLETEISGLITFLGNDTEYLNTIITVARTINLATAAIPEDQLDIKFNAEVEDAGIYTVVATTLEKNYNPAIDVDMFTIFADTKTDVLAWNQELPNILGIIPYKFDEEGNLDFNFGVQNVPGLIENNKLVDGLRNERLTVIYTGITSEGKIYNSSEAPNEPGAYTESFILTGNIADMKVRSFIIQRIGTEIDLDDITLTYGDEFPDTGKIVDAKGDIVQVDEHDAHAVIHFEGLTAGGRIYSSYEIPTDAGVYHMTATYSGNSDYQPTLSITKTLTIVPKTLEIEWNIKDQYIYGESLEDVSYTLNGLQYDDTLTGESYSYYANTIVAPKNVGEYEYVVVLRGNNYVFADNKQTARKPFEIIPKKVDIIYTVNGEEAQPVAIPYGTNVDAIDYELKDLVYFDRENTVSAVRYYRVIPRADGGVYVVPTWKRAIGEPGYYIMAVNIFSKNYEFSEDVENLYRDTAWTYFQIYNEEDVVDRFNTAINLPRRIDADFNDENLANIIAGLDDERISSLLKLNLEPVSSETIYDKAAEYGLKNPIYFDLTLTLFTEYKDSMTTESIHETAEPLTITVKLTDEQVEELGEPSGRYKYYILGEHTVDGELVYEKQTISYQKVDNGNGGYDYIITFKNDEFSSFAVGKKLIPIYFPTKTGIE